jgi:hypothetical protein
MPSRAMRWDGARSMGSPAEADRAGLRPEQPHDRAHGRGLAHAVAAHQGHDLAFADAERDAEQDLAGAV